MGTLHFAIIVASLAFLVFVWNRDRANTSRQRARMFNLCLPLFDQPKLAQHSGDFPSLTGNYQGAEFVLTVLPDTVGYRKIPSLWLQVTLAAALPINGTVDILARAQNTEFFSPSYDLEFALPIPTGWPQPIQFRSNTQNHGLDVTQIEHPIGNLFSDKRIKELLITKRGLRVVYQLAQAEKSRYLVFRMAEFEEITVNPDFLRPLMQELLALRDSIQSRTSIIEA
jgi:hypothetical protein